MQQGGKYQIYKLVIVNLHTKTDDTGHNCYIYRMCECVIIKGTQVLHIQAVEPVCNNLVYNLLCDEPTSVNIFVSNST